MQFYQCGELRVENEDDDIVTYYREEECPCCEKSVYSCDVEKVTESMVFFMRDNTKRRIERKMRKNRRTKEYISLCNVYNLQYGIAISHDGSRFFTSRWEGGIYCFDSSDFSEVWKNTMGRVTWVYTVKKGSRIFCERDGFGLMALDISDGREIGKISGARCETYRLDEDTFIMGEKRGYYYIFRFEDLSEVCRIKKSEVINSDKWVVRNVSQKDGILYFDCFVNCGEARIFEYALK